MTATPRGARRQQRVLWRIRELREAGNGARRIERKLHDEGVENPRSGTAWKSKNAASLPRAMTLREEALALV